VRVRCSPSADADNDQNQLRWIGSKVTEMGTTRHPLKDTLRIPRKTKNSLKKQMKRWLRRRGKTHPEEGLRTQRHKGWYW
jgi:hypothetical protein